MSQTSCFLFFLQFHTIESLRFWFYKSDSSAVRSKRLSSAGNWPVVFESRRLASTRRVAICKTAWDKVLPRCKGHQCFLFLCFHSQRAHCDFPHGKFDEIGYEKHTLQPEFYERLLSSGIVRPEMAFRLSSERMTMQKLAIFGPRPRIG